LAGENRQDGRVGVRDIVGERVAGARRTLLDRAAEVLHGRRPPEPGEHELARGLVVTGTVWAGGDSEPIEGAVVLDERGAVSYLGPTAYLPDVSGLPRLGGGESWVGPGITDAHVHLSFAPGDGLAGVLRSGLVAVRDLGAPPPAAAHWRTGHRRPTGERPVVAVAGPIVTAPGGYPSRSWGNGGFASFVYSPANARQVVHGIAASGVDVVKIALEPGASNWPVPEPRVVRAAVEAAHDAGLAVVAHALSVEMVRRAVDAGVDELAHTPTERLSEQLVERIAGAGVSVISTLQTFFSAGVGRIAAENAADLHAAGVRLRYGTDLGNDGTRPGVDPRELDRLAAAGMGRLGALRAATEYSAQAAGIRHRSGRLIVGSRAALVVLPGNPLDEPGVWRSPSAVVADGRLLVNGTPAFDGLTD
jgi:imidazolonepropionase-like amidohydrolase